MEIKTQLNKPYTDEARIDFIIEQNHNLGYELRETETALEAWGYTAEEIAEQEQERKAMLNLTRGDVFRGLLQARGITRAQLRAVIESLPTEIDGEEITELVVKKELALIDFDEALDFYRGNPLIDTIGAKLDITAEQLDMFFETNDYHYLLPVEPEEPDETEEEIEE